MLQLCADIGHDKFAYMIYERKNAHHQEYQPSNFFDDVRRLSDAMPGKSFRFGDGDDHHVFLFHLDKPYQPESDDLTLEILMHGVDAQAARVFMSGPQRKKEFIKEKSGIWNIMGPGFQVDDHLFEPMGYSLNAIRGVEYYTIHVTPQKIGSYVSFETNCVEGDATAVNRVLDLFKPQSCDVLLFQPQSRPQEGRLRLPDQARRAPEHRLRLPRELRPPLQAGRRARRGYRDRPMTKHGPTRNTKGSSERASV